MGTSSRAWRWLGQRVGQRSERGSMLLELLIWTPLVLGLVVLVAWAGRIPSAVSETRTAARAVARAAALEPSAASATAAGQQAAGIRPGLADVCASWHSNIDTTTHSTEGLVTATVTCRVEPMGGFGAITVEADWSEPVHHAGRLAP